MEDSTKLRHRLQNERPTITDALKSFCSWMLARRSTQFSDWASRDILSTTRWLSMSINRHTAAISGRDQQEKMIVSQVWNEVVGKRQKVTKTLGRTSLRSVWKDLDVHNEKAEDDVTNEKRQLYLQLFERFLFAPTSGEAAASSNGDDINVQDDDHSLLDARLIWDADRGAAEFARRATKRQENAAARIKEEEGEERKNSKDSSASTCTPCIEELKSDPGETKS